MTNTPLLLIDNPAIAGRAERFVTITVHTGKVLAGWRASLMAHEWLTPEGHLRAIDDLNMLDRDKVLKAQKALAAGQALTRPVLGIGIFENIEIGAGRDSFFTLAAAGHTRMDVHIPLSNREEFNRFLA